MEARSNEQTGAKLMELLKILHDAVWNLNEENIEESIQKTKDLFDNTLPISFGYTLCNLVYSAYYSQRKPINAYLQYLKSLFENTDEAEKMNYGIFEIFCNLLILQGNKESDYIIKEMFEQNLINRDILQLPKLRRNFYFVQFHTESEINHLLNFYYWNEFLDKMAELRNNEWELHKKYIEEGVNPNEILKIIRNDEIEKLQEISSQEGFDFNQRIKPSIYERCSFINQENVTLIDYAAFFGSIKCFKYLLMNNAKLENTGKYAIAGGNEEIIHLCEQNHSSFEYAYETAIQFHRNDVFKYLYENKIIEIKNLEKLGEKCISFNNYEILTFLQENKMEINDSIFNEIAETGNIYLMKYFQEENKMPNDILVHSAKSGNIELVKYILEQYGVNVNAQSII